MSLPSKAKTEELREILYEFATRFMQQDEPDIWRFGQNFFGKRELNESETPIRTTSKESSLHSFEKLPETVTFYDDELGVFKNFLKLNYFRDHDDESLAKILQKARIVDFEEDSDFNLIQDLSLYFIQRGQIVIESEDGPTYIDHNSIPFSYQQLEFRHKSNSFEVKAGSKLCILDDLVIREHLSQANHKNCRQYEDLLQSNPLFSSLTEETIKLLSDSMITKHFKANEVIYQMDIRKIDLDEKYSCGLYFIETGIVATAIKRKSRNCQIFKNSGDYFGQLITSDEAFLVKAVAKSDVICVYLSSEAYNNLMQHSSYRS